MMKVSASRRSHETVLQLLACQLSLVTEVDKDVILAGIVEGFCRLQRTLNAGVLQPIPCRAAFGSYLSQGQSNMAGPGADKNRKSALLQEGVPFFAQAAEVLKRSLGHSLGSPDIEPNQARHSEQQAGRHTASCDLAAGATPHRKKHDQVCAHK